MAANKKTATAKAPEPVEAVVAASQETVDQVVKASTEAATKSVEKAVEASQEQVAVVAKAGVDAFKAYEDAVAYGKDNFDAILKANALFTKGFQAINKEVFSIVQASFEENASVTKKVLACTTVQDVVALQSDTAQESYTKVIDQSKKITDMSVKIAEEAVVPLTKRVNVTVEKFSKPLAA